MPIIRVSELLIAFLNPNTGFTVLLVSAIAVAQPTVPPLLEQAMRRLPGLRLLDPSIDLGLYTVEDLRSFGYWPPWITMDVDRDGRADVVAVVVKPGATSQFGVIAVHAGGARSGSIQWVATLGDHEINGVRTGPAPDTVEPLYCVECDANYWYRWSGRSYETDLYAVGEKLLTTDREVGRELTLFAQPSRDSKRVSRMESCVQATVLAVAGSKKHRWYFVEVSDGQRVRGWIPDSFVAGSGSGDCIA